MSGKRGACESLSRRNVMGHADHDTHGWDSSVHMTGMDCVVMGVERGKAQTQYHLCRELWVTHVSRDAIFHS